MWSDPARVCDARSNHVIGVGRLGDVNRNGIVAARWFLRAQLRRWQPFAEPSSVRITSLFVLAKIPKKLLVGVLFVFPV